MTAARKQYRDVIDRLVKSCLEGQGQISADRARRGVWNPNALGLGDGMEDQAAMNDLLARLAPEDRELLASILSEQFVHGVHETLVVLHEEQVPPFDEGYEGSPFHDFVGRLDGWPWPTTA
ncbi:DUF6547 family protein [Kineosporia sp. A_224]|uniref:DUF6547 family protein n=1 Tax=Kineosporia sp. A_224 TaxID=1962180 RepID=UPI000B4B9931|nr:DUF6547 family protein [Kineosporia sp. A_224]